MTTGTCGYWGRLLAALAGRDAGPAVAPGSPDEQLAQVRAQAAALQLDLAERDRQMAEMRAEYGTLHAAKQWAAADAGQDQLERLFKKLAGPLANLAVLTAAVEAGQEVEARDLVQLLKSVERELHRAGLEPIGRVGQRAQFDVASHQRMSGGAVHAGTPVTVQLPGYRSGEKILLKAMVSAGETEDFPPVPRGD